MEVFDCYNFLKEITIRLNINKDPMLLLLLIVLEIALFSELKHFNNIVISLVPRCHFCCIMVTYKQKLNHYNIDYYKKKKN